VARGLSQKYYVMIGDARDGVKIRKWFINALSVMHGSGLGEGDLSFLISTLKGLC
jgi:hypothetical protein